MAIFGKPPDAKPVAPGAPPQPGGMPASVPAPSQPAMSVAPGGAPRRLVDPHSVCVIGPQITIKGEITGDEDILVEGVIEGQVKITKELRVGERGTVRAAVEAQSIIVSGELMGDCSATNRVEIQSSGRLTGDIRAPRIVIAEGAMFRGNSDMSPRPESKTGTTGA
jgi:cytoskeletal protein CcmA (bactofilin family)